MSKLYSLYRDLLHLPLSRCTLKQQICIYLATNYSTSPSFFLLYLYKCRIIIESILPLLSFKITSAEIKLAVQIDKKSNGLDSF